MWASLVAQTIKNMPAMQETRARSLGQEDPLEKGMATHSNTLAWRIPWTAFLPSKEYHSATFSAQASPQSNFKIILPLKKETATPHSPPPASCNLKLFSVPIQDTSYKWNHTIRGLL